MALLLAKKLTNQLNKLAEQACIELELDLHNFHEGERRAAGCKGKIHHPKTGARVEFVSYVSRPTVHIGFIRLPHGMTPDETHIIDPADAAEKIVNLLTQEPPAREPLTHENVAKSGITNLPDLSKNTLLATYLCDASTGTSTWRTGRSNLGDTLAANGFDLSNFAHYPPLHDAKAYEVAHALWSSLAQSSTEDHMVCHHLLAYHDVRPSETVKGRLAYFQDDDKRAKGIRTPIKVRKYLQKFFGNFRTPETLEHIAETLDEVLVDPSTWDVRLYSDAQIDGWRDAYYHVKSCMNIKEKQYGVGTYETYRCYCTAAMTSGAKSSGLSLAVLYQDGTPVARAITYEGIDGKVYVRNYGDDRLVRWLEANDYTNHQGYPLGTHLWTEVFYKDTDEYLSPYVDGDDDTTQAEIAYIDGQPYWVIGNKGVELRNCCGYTCAIQHTCCCCGDPLVSGDEYRRTNVHGDEVTLCYVCEENYCYTVDDTYNLYISEHDRPNLISTNAQGYYTQEYFDNHDLVITGVGDAISLCEAEYCPYDDEYYSWSDFTDLSGEPEFVRDTWSGYINDNNRVHTSLYNSVGTYIHDLDCLVHRAHAEDVLAKLENES